MKSVLSENLKIKVQKYLNRFSPRYQEILKMRLGMADGKIYTFREIAEKFGVSISRIRQIYHQTIDKIEKFE